MVALRLEIPAGTAAHLNRAPVAALRRGYHQDTHSARWRLHPGQARGSGELGQCGSGVGLHVWVGVVQEVPQQLCYLGAH